MDIFLLTRLKGPDLVTLTAEDTLRRRMNLGKAFQGLLREEFYKVVPQDGVAGESDHNELVSSILTRTTLLVNPNKHAFRVMLGRMPEPIHQAEDHFTSRYLISERTPDFHDSLAGRLRQRYGLPVKSLKSGILWTILLENKSSRDERERLLERIVVSRNRKEGLLCNPHYEIAERID